MTATVIDFQKYREAKRLREEPPISLGMWSDAILQMMFPPMPFFLSDDGDKA